MEHERSRLAYYFAACASGLIGGIGDVFLNQWAKGTRGAGSLAVGFALCNVALAGFVWMLRRAPLASAVIVYLVAGTALTYIASRFVLNEQISRQRLFGVVVALTGLAIAEAG